MEQTGRVDAQFITTDIVKENREFRPEPSIIPIGENSKVLSQKLAEQVSKKVDELLEDAKDAR